MHGQENYASQIAQGSCPPPPSFQQCPVATTRPPPPPPPPYRDLLTPQPQVIQQGPPSFQLAPGGLAYPHAQLGTPHQGPPAPLLSSSNSQMPHSYPASGKHQSWNQNVQQYHGKTTLPTPSAYPMPSSQGYTTEQVPAHQPPSQHVPPPPPYPSNSTFSKHGPFGSSVQPMPQQSYLSSMRPLPPPPPLPQPPPPPPTSSPPGAPPLPSSPPSENMSKNCAGRSLKEDIRDGNNLMLDCPPTMNCVDDRSVYKIEGPDKSTVTNQSEVKTAVAVITESPADSDMDMEDDITQPDEEEKQNYLSNNLNDDFVSISRGVNVKEQLQMSPHTGNDRPAEVSVDENLPFAGSSVSKDQKVGSEVPSDCYPPGPMGVHSDADSIISNRETEQPLNVSLKKYSIQHGNIHQLNVPVASAENGNEKLSGQLMGNANPVKLLQGYASENSSDNDDQNLDGDVSSPSIKVESRRFNAECHFGSELRPESLSESSELMPSEYMAQSPKNVMQTDKMSSVIGKDNKLADKSNKTQEAIGNDTYVAAQPGNSSRNHGSDIGLEGIKLQKPDAKMNSKPNVDEFGRLVREGVSDSDSGSPRYTRTHARRSRKRSRSQSRSRSPRDRRRRSPRRRTERRGRSRSMSPKRRRSRSRSPVLRRGSEIFGDRGRRDKSQLPECFDFLRGKCYRGSTCRFTHHEFNKSERLRYNRGRQQSQDVASNLLSPDLTEEARVAHLKKIVDEDKEVKDKGLKRPPDMPGLKEAKDADKLLGVPVVCSSDKLNSSVSLQNVDVVSSSISGCSAYDVPTGNKNLLVREILSHYPDKVPEIAEEQPKKMDNSLISESSHFQSSTATSAHVPTGRRDAETNPVDQPHSVAIPIMKPYSNEEVSSQSLRSKEFSFCIANHPWQLPLPLSSISQVTDASIAPQDYHLRPPIAKFHLNPGNYSPYQAPVAYQHSHFPDPSSTSSSSFRPLPRPPQTHLNVNVATGEYNNLSQNMQEASLPPRNDLSSYASIRTYATELPNPSQSGQYEAYPSAEPDQMANTTVDFGSRTLNPSNLPSQQGGHHVMGDRITGHPVQSMKQSHSFAQTQPNSVLVQSVSKGMHASPCESLPPHIHPYSQQASYNLQYSGANAPSAQLGEAAKVSSSMSEIGPDVEKKQPSGMPDFLRPRISNNLNPYASTFDQPMGSNFSLAQEKDTSFDAKHSAISGLSSFPVDEHKIGSLSSKNMIASSSFTAAEVLPRVGGDQYDPLFDSIEPASNSFSKNETTGDSDNIIRFNGSGKVLNMGEIKQEGGAAISANNSVENEDYGETADAVLSGSPSNANDATNMNIGEFEINQVKSSGKKKKGKDSKSMKLFKISIATFVKAVLKPSWRQGNMSKEAFKTIVKKTVDKVSGAMKSHQIPKSQAKINHYIDSSRGKLTKLVMGYVDKYVKV